MLLLEVQVESGRQDERRPAAVELAHEARFVGLLVSGQLARPVELPTAPRVAATVLPAVVPASAGQSSPPKAQATQPVQRAFRRVTLSGYIEFMKHKVCKKQ